MQHYGRNKFRTVCQIVQKIKNWPTAIGLRLRKDLTGELRLLVFRDGLNLICRTGTRDWDVIHELVFAGSYGRAFQYLGSLPGHSKVLDLGGNIGLFSLLCARHAPAAEIHAFEPVPPNYQLFEMNCLANPSLASRINLHKNAVGGESREDRLFFDEANPGGSSLFGRGENPFPVRIVSFAEVIASFGEDIALAKIDIEGAEYEILEKTPPSVWQRIAAISLELHNDPSGKRSQDDFLNRFRELGYAIEEEQVCSFFLRKKQP